MKLLDLAWPFAGKGLFLLGVAWAVFAILFPRISRADTSLTILVTNIPPGWGTANGDSVAVIGTMNGWALGTVATVENHSLRYVFSSVSTAALGPEWIDRPAGANLGFRFVAAADAANTLVKTDFRSNDGNFRLAIREGAANVVEIDAGPVRTLIDQASAVRVNGVREREYVAIDRERFAFPGGFWKALVMSYDDGHVQDRGLIPIFDQYGIKGTFHLCSEWLDQATFVGAEDVRTIYAKHEVSGHSVNHPTLSDLDDESIRWQVGHCRWALSQLAGYDVCGMSYPMGGYDAAVLAQIAGQGITCSRTVEATFSLDFLPADPLKWHPTCHHANASAFADEFVARTQEQMALLFIWGHSYELDNGYADNSWDYMAALCRKLGHRGDVWYAGMEEVRAYLAAIQALAYPAENVVRNPSASIAVWAKPADALVKIAPGKTVTWPAGEVAVAPAIPCEGAEVSIVYDPGSNALSRAANVFIRVGHDGWQDARDVALSPRDDGAWAGSYAVPAAAESVEWAFSDGGSVWDDNGGRDWRLAVRPAAAGAPAAIDFAEGAPIILAKDGSDQNAVGEAVDFNPDGRSAGVLSQGGFGGFGSIQINCDADCLYLGGTGLDAGGSNNAVLLFLQIDTLPNPATTLWDFAGTPYGLDFLHNAVFDPGVNVAILLGDEYGDGNFMHFNLESGADIGQGAFYVDTAVRRFIPVPGVRLSQFDGASNAPTASSDDDGNRRTDRWEIAIPWSSLNAPLGAASVGSCHLSGLIAGDGVSGNDRYLSGNVLGSAAAGTLAGNYGFNVVALTGQRIGLPGADSDRDGMPDVWENKYRFDPASSGDAAGDGDRDGLGNLEEYVAETDPGDPASCLRADGSAEGSGFVVRSPMSSNRVYTLYGASNLVNAAWIPVPGQGPRRGTGAADSMVDTRAAPRRYYRLQVRMP